MTESSDSAPETGPPEDVSTTVEVNDVAVRKVTTLHREDAVAITIRIESKRSDRCEVHVSDPLPEPFRDNFIEFHPGYDPENWSRRDTAVVYETTMEPGAQRTTVYGILIDGQPDLESFAADPEVEVTGFVDIFKHWSEDEQDDASGTGARDSPLPGAQDGQPSGDQRGQAVDSEGQRPVDSVGEQPAESEEAQPADTGGQEHLVQAFLSELRQGDLSDAEQTALREAIDLGDETGFDRQLSSLREDVDTLKAAVATIQEQSVEADRFESRLQDLSDDIEERFRSLAVDLENMRAEMERWNQWRSKVQETITRLPDEE